MTFDLKKPNPFKGRPFETRKKRRRWFLFIGFFPFGLFLLTYFFFFPPSSPPPPPSEVFPLETSPAQDPPLNTIEGGIKERSTLFKSLLEKNIPLQWIDLIISKLKPLVNFKKIKGGTYQLITDVKGELVKFIYEVNPTEIYEIERDPQGYTAKKKGVILETRLVKVMGEIRSSLFEAIEAAGEQDGLTIAFADILAWEIDFYKDVREGDRFKLLVEKVYKGDQFIQYGAIHAVEYRRGEKVIRGIRYRDDFYNEKGISLRAPFLKAPLRFNRISSTFSRARNHPILGGVRPHYGIDYAAPLGTPVWAVADGTVTFCGWNGGYGKQVILRHKNGYTTHYGHLSAYGPGIKMGVGVQQKQIIGYVGSTGLSTGPHLDYRLAKDQLFRNPLRETFPTGSPIVKSEMGTFQMKKEEMLAWLEGETVYSKKIEGGGQIH
ncbi:MAG: M23 family metallopeptidase [Syntrophaceae bacterium]|nr:M23 family metallopeptidase [Syntrophaceae bacterium]